VVAVDEGSLAHGPAVVAAGGDLFDFFQLRVANVHQVQLAGRMVPGHAVAVAEAKGINLIEGVRVAVDERIVGGKRIVPDARLPPGDGGTSGIYAKQSSCQRVESLQLAGLTFGITSLRRAGAVDVAPVATGDIHLAVVGVAGMGQGIELNVAV